MFVGHIRDAVLYNILLLNNFMGIFQHVKFKVKYKGKNYKVALIPITTACMHSCMQTSSVTLTGCIVDFCPCNAMLAQYMLWSFVCLSV